MHPYSHSSKSPSPEPTATTIHIINIYIYTKYYAKYLHTCLEIHMQCEGLQPGDLWKVLIIKEKHTNHLSPRPILRDFPEPRPRGHRSPPGCNRWLFPGSCGSGGWGCKRIKDPRIPRYLDLQSGTFTGCGTFFRPKEDPGMTGTIRTVQTKRCHRMLGGVSIALDPPTSVQHHRRPHHTRSHVT